MKLLKFDSESINALSLIGEAGMDFSIVTGHCDDIPENSPVAVRSNGYAIPLEEANEDIYSLKSMLEGKHLPKRENEVEISIRKPVVYTALSTITLASGYQASYGAHQLLGTITLSYPTKFFRYTSNNLDHRYSGGQIVQDTYLTSFNDQQFVNSGFGAVGRYALPLPLPASHEHQYTFPAGTSLLVGTVAPQYGQAGGGVEVKTISPVSGVIHDGSKPINDY